MSAYIPPITHNGDVNTTFNSQDFESTYLDTFLPITGGTITGALQITGGLDNTGVISTTSLNATGLVTASSLYVNGTQVASFIVGMIILWSGSEVNIPSGWSLCDGTNNTPDLRNRFVVGAASIYSPDDTGGSADAIIPSHTHSGTTASAGAHVHTLRIRQSRDPGGANLTNQNYEYNGLIENAYTNTTTFSAGAHSHSLNISSTGVSVVNKNLPPYYALCYIMKI